MVSSSEEAIEGTGLTSEEDGERSKQASSGKRRTRLCSLRNVEVGVTDGGFQIFVTTSLGRRTIVIPPAEAERVFRELETAFNVIRSQM